MRAPQIEITHNVKCELSSALRRRLSTLLFDRFLVRWRASVRFVADDRLTDCGTLVSDCATRRAKRGAACHLCRYDERELCEKCVHSTKMTLRQSTSSRRCFAGTAERVEHRALAHLSFLIFFVSFESLYRSASTQIGTGLASAALRQRAC